jgi:hypothetical protein
MSEYTGFRIKEIHAIVAVGDDDEEGVVAYLGKLGSIPLIAADPKRLDIIKAMAQVVADQLGKNFKVVRFSIREDIGEIRSEKNEHDTT